MSENLRLEEQLPSVRTLSLATGTIGGFLVAESALVLLGHMNLEMAEMWHDLFTAAQVHMRSALIWWLMAGTALVGGFVTAALT
jgi:hypothetical protein